MKRTVLNFLTVVVALLCVVSATAPKPAQGDEQRLARIDRRIADLSLHLNHMTWGCYIDYAGRTRRTISIDRFKGADWQALLDTVPELKAAQQRYRAASDRVTELLRTDPEYEAIHREYISLKGVKDKAKNDVNLQRYNLIYSRLRASNPDYPAANSARQKAYRERNAALTRYLLDYYREQGRQMPTTDVIKGSGSEMNILREECPEIVAVNEELAVLRSLRKELRERMLRKEYDLRNPRNPKRIHTGAVMRQ